LEALRELQTVYDAAPDAPSVHSLAGRAYLKSAQLRHAEQAFERVLELDPADHYAYFGLGKALQRQGRLREAHGKLKLAGAMNPLPEYQEALGEVRARIAVREDHS
jgi:Flp pilus assembly protein TadD